MKNNTGKLTLNESGILTSVFCSNITNTILNNNPEIIKNQCVLFMLAKKNSNTNSQNFADSLLALSVMVLNQTSYQNLY